MPRLPEETPDLATVTHLRERFLPSEPVRGIAPSLCETPFGVNEGPVLPETLRVWDAAAAAWQERYAVHALYVAEDHLRRLVPDLMAHYDAQRGAGVDPVPAMATAQAEMQSLAMESLYHELAIEASERGLSGRTRDDWVDRQLDDLIDPRAALPPPGRAAVAMAGEYRAIAAWEAALAVNQSLGQSGPPAVELVDHPPPIDGYLGAYVAAGDHLGLCQLAEELGHRRDELSDRTREVLVQEQSVAALLVPPYGPPDAVGIPPAAVATCLASHIASTGGDVATVGMALGVEPEWARGVLTGAVPVIDAAHVQAMCVALGSSPEELFGPPGERLDGAPAITTALDIASLAETFPARHLLDSAGFLRADEMLADVTAMDPDQLGDLVRALATRHSQLAAWAEDVAVRQERATALLQPPRPVPHDFATTGPLPLSAAAAAAQIEILLSDTGDDVDTIARGLGLEPTWVSEVVAGTVDTVDADHARQLCDALELSPASVFGVAGMALEGPTSAWAMVPYDPFDHELHLELLEPPPPAIDLDFGP